MSLQHESVMPDGSRYLLKLTNRDVAVIERRVDYAPQPGYRGSYLCSDTRAPEPQHRADPGNRVGYPSSSAKMRQGLLATNGKGWRPMDKDTTAAEPAAESDEQLPEQRFDALQHEIRLATRSSRYALATAVAAAMVSAGVSAWASVHVSGTQMDRQEQLAREQAIRSDREKVYTELVTDHLDFVSHLGLVRAALAAHPPDKQNLFTAVGDTQASMTAMAKAEAAVKIVGSAMDPILANLDAAELALFQGPESIGPAIHYAHERDQLVDDALWASVSTPAVAAIDKFVSDNSIDQLAERARTDLGSG